MGRSRIRITQVVAPASEAKTIVLKEVDHHLEKEMIQNQIKTRVLVQMTPFLTMIMVYSEK